MVVSRWREGLLRTLYSTRGLARTVNDVKVRVAPQYRARFPRHYDAPVARFFRERALPGMTSLNVGANVGVYALQFAAWTSPNGQVIAFEPNPMTAGILRQHFAMNRIQSRASVVQCAVSSEAGTAVFHASGTDGMSRLGSPNPLLESTSEIRVEVTTLDKYCEAENVTPQLVMIDVEGFEFAVLSGFRRTLELKRDMHVAIELHPSEWPALGWDGESIRVLLSELKLGLVPLTGQSDPLKEYGIASLELR